MFIKYLGKGRPGTQSLPFSLEGEELQAKMNLATDEIMVH